MGYQDGRRYGEDRYYSDRDRGGSRYGANRDRYGSDERSYRYGTRGQFGSGGDYGRGRDDRYDPDDRGFFDRASDEVRSWFGDEEAERRREYDERYDREHDDSYGRGRYETTGDRGRYAQNRSYGSDYGNRSRPYGPQEGRGAHHDHNYHSWRQQRIEELDRDYAEYQNEHRDRFNTEFGSWRTRRGEQRQAVQQVREHMEVVGSDGEHVGTVDKLRGDRIILTKTDTDAGGMHHSVPSSWIKSVDATRVTLEKTADQAQTAWRTEREQNAMFGDRDQQSSSQGYGAASASTTSYQTNRDR
ncbi:DUF2171 domain-containing protein [Sphingobium sp.]|uniref:DUF2171 domain-containing protein n=1 Tax=Sphingobium sp. TaxID=1912891 RepID=UPI003BB71688